MSKITATATKVGAKEIKKNVLSGVKVKTSKVFVGTANYEDSIAEDSANVTIGVFFDGTLNNRENTKARIAYEKANVDSYKQPTYPLPDSPTTPSFFSFKKAKPPKENPELSAAAKRYKEVLQNVDKEDRGSYDNDLSNIARMEPAYEEKSTEKQYTTKVYVEGIATNDLETDVIHAAKYGTREAGVLKKVEKACIQAADKIQSVLKNTDVEEIKYLRIDVFGFSRGAAAARNFVHEVNLYKGDKKTIFNDNDKTEKNAKKGKKYEHRYGELGEQLAAKGYKVKILIVRFAGLYDTVASYGSIHYEDTEDLTLDAVGKAHNVFQLAAQDEHRENFVLTEIQSAGSRGLQCMIPGVHSDIGGGYTNNYQEKNLLIKDNDLGFFGARSAKKLREYLIEDNWYKPEEITINNLNGVLINRTVASNAYSFIPLHIMVEYAITKKNPFQFSKINSKYGLTEDSCLTLSGNEKTTIQVDLKSIKLRLDSYVKYGGAPMSFSNENDRDMLRVIRTNYMHTSAHYNDKVYGYAGLKPHKNYIVRKREDNDG